MRKVNVLPHGWNRANDGWHRPDGESAYGKNDPRVTIEVCQHTQIMDWVGVSVGLCLDCGYPINYASMLPSTEYDAVTDEALDEYRQLWWSVMSGEM